MMKRADHHPQKGRNGLAMSAKATPTPPKSEGFPMTKATSTAKEATEKGRDGLILAYICHVCRLQRTKADGFPMSQEPPRWFADHSPEWAVMSHGCATNPDSQHLQRSATVGICGTPVRKKHQHSHFTPTSILIDVGVKRLCAYRSPRHSEGKVAQCAVRGRGGTLLQPLTADVAAPRAALSA